MTKSDLLSNLPPVPSDDLLPTIREALESSERSIVVLDDDPSGTQSVFDVPVLTDLSPDAIRDAIDQAPPLLFLLTNSHALTSDQSNELHQNLGKVLKEYDDEIIVISRSDSTQAGHVPPETNTLKNALNIPEAPTLLIPFSESENHLTVKDTHYLVEGDSATPLFDILNEKSDRPIDIQSISLEDLRSGNVAEKLADLPPNSTCLVNATTLRDLGSLSLALHQSKRRFLIRSAASFVQSLAGIISRPPLDSWQMQDLEPNPNGGIIIVGSHSSKTSDQLKHLLKNAPKLTPIKLSIPDIQNSTFNLHRTTQDVQDALTSGQSVVLFTSHTDKPTISKIVAQTFVDIVKSIDVRPSFLIAKGGTTASDIATTGLGVKQAQVLGQILPGVPVWTIGNETSHPGLAYIIFPSNVGGEDALTQAYQKLSS